MIVALADAAATAALGAAVAVHLRRGDLVVLHGDLGAGKTTLVRGMLTAMGHDGPVPSPTFTLVQEYAVAPAPVFHFDLYRIAAAEEIAELGFEEALAEGIAVVEWPDMLGDAMPADRLEIALAFDEAGTSRIASLRGYGDWGARLRGLAA
jgi:tRNA threonylcarbamoyladenosine biosynthesis protein TsaE